jgi:hypothetical protein
MSPSVIVVANAGEAMTAELALIDALADVAVVDNEEDLRCCQKSARVASSGVVERRELADAAQWSPPACPETYGVESPTSMRAAC